MLSELLTFLRQPVDKRDYRAIAVVGVLGALVGAALGIAFQLFLGSTLLWFLAAWLYGRQARGQTLLDCGPHPHRQSYLVAAVVCPILALSRGLPIGSSATVYEVASFAVLVLAGILLFFMAVGRLQLRENGVWQYWRLLRWGKIESYCWADDGTWSVEVRGLLFAGGSCCLCRGPLPVPPEYKDAFDQLLQKHGAVEDK